MQLNSLTTGFCACVELPLALHNILVVEGTLAEVHIPVAVQGILVAVGTPVVDILEEASAALQSRIVAAHMYLLHKYLVIQESDMRHKEHTYSLSREHHSASRTIETQLEYISILPLNH